MMRLNLVLLIAVLASALYLVRTQYESRRLFTEVDKAMGEARKLQIENERLQVEKRAPGHAVARGEAGEGTAADAHGDAGHYAVRHARRVAAARSAVAAAAAAPVASAGAQ